MSIPPASLNAEVVDQLRDAVELLAEHGRQQKAMAALISDISVAIARGGDSREMLSAFTAAVVQHMGAAFARIWTLAQGADILELQASSGLYTHVDGEHARVPVGSFKIGRIAANREPHLSNNVPGDPEVSDHEWARSNGITAFAGYPLICGSNVIGVLAAFSKTPLTEVELNLLASVSSIITQAIERKRIEAHESARTEQLQKLAEAAAAITSQDTADRILGTVRDQAQVALGAELLSEGSAGDVAVVDVTGRPAAWLRPGPHTFPEILNQFAQVASGALQNARLRNEAEQARYELEELQNVAMLLSAELDLGRLVQAVTDAGVRLSRASFGAFFYNVLNEDGGEYLLYTLSGAPIEKFREYGVPHATELFGPTFRGEGVVRSDDVREDPRYGKYPPHYGLPEGHLPVVSYLGVPVKGRSGAVLGGLFFGHPERGIFNDRAERLVVMLAGWAAVGVENARLYESALRRAGSPTPAIE
ncbi:MAG TPA: GAF domain-containing protein [Bryobacteraceae bacterium]|nr:GAF domain-containing protein [Bryobacteraceae bacterium]